MYCRILVLGLVLVCLSGVLSTKKCLIYQVFKKLCARHKASLIHYWKYPYNTQFRLVLCRGVREVMQTLQPLLSKSMLYFLMVHLVLINETMTTKHQWYKCNIICRGYAAKEETPTQHPFIPLGVFITAFKSHKKHQKGNQGNNFVDNIARISTMHGKKKKQRERETEVQCVQWSQQNLKSMQDMVL